MTKFMITVVLLITTKLFSQGQFEQGMGKAFALWGDGKNTEASAMFERIASAEQENWLPNYYVALINTSAAFQTKDKEQVNALLTKAQRVIDAELNKDQNQNNAELLVLQAMIHTAWISFDPMNNGMRLTGKVMELYGKAESIEPNNPRVVFSKAEFEMGSARFFGTDTKPICAQIEKSIELFATFKPQTGFHPNWGLERAQKAMNACK